MIELLVVIAIIAILAAILFPVFAQAREKARQTSCLSNCKQLGLGVYQYVQDYDEALPFSALSTSVPGYATHPSRRWYLLLEPYVKNTGVYVCPSASDLRLVGVLPGANTGQRVPLGYGINNNLCGIASLTAPGGRALAELADSAGTSLIVEAVQFKNTILTKNDPSQWDQSDVDATTDYQFSPPGDFAANSSRWATCGNSNNDCRRPVARHNKGLNVIYCDGHAKWSEIKRFLGPLPNPAGGWGWEYGHASNAWDNR